MAFVSEMPAALETEVGTVFAPDAFPPGVVILTIELRQLLKISTLIY